MHDEAEKIREHSEFAILSKKRNICISSVLAGVFAAQYRENVEIIICVFAHLISIVLKQKKFKKIGGIIPISLSLARNSQAPFFSPLHTPH